MAVIQDIDFKTHLLVEICCGSVEAASEAFRLGARRIELCDDLPCGGVTPRREVILRCLSLRQSISANSMADGPIVHVLIRPRPGDFVYSDAELDTMLSDIEFCASAGVDGVVIGALHADGTVDTGSCSRMISLARSLCLSVTFHRAIDSSRNPLEALEDIIPLGADRILTSGGAPTAPEGIAVICNMIRTANGRIGIMPGSGITPENAPVLLAAVHAAYGDVYAGNPDATPIIEIHGSRPGLLTLR